MSNYSFVSIFAFILVFYVSTGNAEIRCYYCGHNLRGLLGSVLGYDPDPNCVNVNWKTGTTVVSKKIWEFGTRETCGFMKFEDGSMLRGGTALTISTANNFCANKPPGTCQICYTDLCNTMSGSPIEPPTSPTTSRPPTTTSPPSTTSVPPNMSLAQMEPILISLTLTGVLKTN